MKKNLLALSVIGLSFIPYAIAHAFWSYLSFADHQTITKTALSAPNTYCFSTTNCFSFSANAVEQINQVHQVVDDPSNYNASNHFDSSFSASVNQIAKNREQFNRLVNGSAPAGAFIPSNPAFPRMQIQAWQLLGYMLHAAEDFYAHSTWVDEGNTDPLPTGFGALTENTATPTIPPIFFSPANTLDLRQTAFGLGEQEAQAFVQSIVTDLVTANNAAGFCALLGLPSSTPMCNACSPVEGASSCAAVLYTPGFYNPGELGAPVPVVGTQTVNGTTTQSRRSREFDKIAWSDFGRRERVGPKGCGQEGRSNLTLSANPTEIPPASISRPGQQGPRLQVLRSSRPSAFPFRKPA